MIATPADVFLELQRPSASADETALAERKIEAYQAELEDHLKRSVEQREFVEDLLPANGGIRVSRGPIASVTTVEIGGVEQDSSTWQVVGREEVWVSGAYGVPVHITYVGGWPEDRVARARDVVVSRCARYLRAVSAGSLGVASESIEAEGIRHSVTLAAEASNGSPAERFTDDELESVSVLRLRTRR